MRSLSLSVMVLTSVLLIAGLHSPAQAQTASETVAFILEGLEDGASYEHKEDNITYSGSVEHQIGSHLYKIIESDSTGKGRIIEESFLDKGNCRFSILYKFNDPNFSDFDALIDMSKYSHAGVENGRFVHFFSGTCAVSMGGECVEEFYDIGLRKDTGRLEKAVAYYKANFCPQIGAF